MENAMMMTMMKSRLWAGWRSNKCWQCPQHDNVWWRDERCKALWETRGTATRPRGRRSDPNKELLPGYWDQYQERDLIKFDEVGDGPSRRRGWGLGEEINLNLQRDLMEGNIP